MNELQQNVPAGGIVIAMCATKCDLAMNPDTSQAEALAAQTGAMFMTTSSKANSNVHLLFQKVTERVLDYQRRNAGLDIPVSLSTTAVETTQNQNNNILSNAVSLSSAVSRTSINNDTNGSSSLPFTNSNGTRIGNSQSSTVPEKSGRDVTGSNFVDEKKIEHEENELLDTKNVISDDSNASKEYVNKSRCDTNMLMCGDVVGVTSEDGWTNGCTIQ
ncbi:MAG: hypothetical protein ACI8RD_000317 [Bacillariaceae sp.]|jgi:hypothetical protein